MINNETSTGSSLDLKPGTEETGVNETDYNKVLNSAITVMKGMFKEKTMEIEQDISKFKERVDSEIKNNKETVEKIENKQIRTIETLAIFVALFTFISVEFQLFKYYQSPQAISGLTLIFLGSLLTFLTVLDFVLNINLPIIKTKKIPGYLESMVDKVRKTIGTEETIEFSWFKSSSWGPAIKIKYMPLISLWFIFIMSGTLLFICSNQNSKLNSYPENNSSVKIENNTFIPKN